MKSSDSHGYIMKTKCPQGAVRPEIRAFCESVDSTDFLRGMPVVDELEGVIYRNVFCARCNAVKSVSYWRMTADCGRIPASVLPQDNTLLLAFIQENCTVNYSPTDAQQTYLKKCLAAESNCSSKQIVDKEPVLRELCSYYALPVCGDINSKNPHCALCNGNDITQLNCKCQVAATSHPLTHVTSTTGSTTSPRASTLHSTSPPQTANPGTTHLLHTTNSGSSKRPHTTSLGTTNPLHTTMPATTHVLIPPTHSTNPGATHPTHSTNPEKTHPTHSTNPGTTHPPHSMHQPPKTPGITHKPYTSRPWTTPIPYYTTRLPHNTKPRTPEQQLTTMRVTAKWPHPSEPPPLTPPPPPPPPPLSILFDFSSNEISIHGKTTETKVVEQKTCQDGFVYDPFIKKCREAFLKVILSINSSINSTNSSSDVITMLNCSGIQLSASEVVLYPNGTLWVPLHATEYNRTDYFMNDSHVFLCTNFAGNYSKRETTTRWSYVVSSLQILTYAGCSVSVLSLLILLVIYCIFQELRTLPGKNLMNLSFAMTFYHIFLFLAGFSIQVICTGIAIFLHYLYLY